MYMCMHALNPTVGLILLSVHVYMQSEGVNRKPTETILHSTCLLKSKILSGQVRIYLQLTKCITQSITNGFN